MKQTTSDCKLLMDGEVIGKLRHSFYDFPWHIDEFTPTPQYEPIRHLFELENRLNIEQERLLDLLDEDRENEKTRSRLKEVEDELDQVEAEIDGLSFQVDCGESRHNVVTIHIREGKADYKLALPRNS